MPARTAAATDATANQRRSSRGLQTCIRAPLAAGEPARRGKIPYLSSYANPALRVFRKSRAANKPTATHSDTDTRRCSGHDDDDDDERLLVGEADWLREDGRCLVMAVNKTNVVSNSSLSEGRRGQAGRAGKSLWHH